MVATVRASIVANVVVPSCEYLVSGAGVMVWCGLVSLLVGLKFGILFEL